MAPQILCSSTLTRASNCFAAAQHVVVLSGAGISAESGLRTFRGASTADLPADMRALWADFDPLKLATPHAFAADPAAVSRWYDWRRLGCLAAQPNPGHLALAALERVLKAHGRRFTLLTQNVDRLHHRAGNADAVELHGDLLRWRCTRTHRLVELGTAADPAPQTTFPIPSPFHPTAILRPNVVWFGESLPDAAVEAADQALQSCDVFLTVGTSAQVYPAAGFLHIAKARGATTIEVNLDPTAASATVDFALHGPAGTLLPALFHAAFPADPSLPSQSPPLPDNTRNPLRTTPQADKRPRPV